MALVVGLFVYTPLLRQQIEVLTTGGPRSPDYQPLARRGRLVGMLLGVDVVVIVFLMVTKPVL